MHRWLLVSALALSTLLPASVAQADVYVGIGIGPTLRLDNWPNQVRVEQEIGYSFGGRSGFFLSFAPSQSWGNEYWMLVFPLGIGGLFDVYRSGDFAFQLGPMGHVGLALADDFDRSDRDVDLWFHFGAAFMVRFMILNDRLGIYLKPIGLEFGAGDSVRGHGRFDARFYLAGGVQYYF